MSARRQTSPQVGGAAVADRDGRVGAQQQADERPADQVRAADDHRLLARGVHAGAGRAAPSRPRGVQGTRPGSPRASRPALDRGQPVDVLGRVERVDDRVGVEVVGQRQLDEDAVHLVVGVQLARPGPAGPPGRRRRAGSWWMRADPDLLATPRACRARRSPRRGRRRPGRSPGPAGARAPALSASTSSATRSRTSAATALPSITVAVIGAARYLSRPSAAARSRPSACARSRRRRSARRSRRRARPPVTTPSPKLAWTTSSPVPKCRRRRPAARCPSGRPRRRRPSPSAPARSVPSRSTSSSGSSARKREG